MTLVGSVCALILALVLASAAATKLADQPGTARSFRALGLRRTYALARAVPLSELALAAALVLFPGVGAAGAVVLLTVFSVFLAERLRAGVRVPCGCFGSRGKDPLSSRHLARNGALGLGGLAVVAAFGWDPAPWQLTAVAALALALVVAISWTRAVRPGRP